MLIEWAKIFFKQKLIKYSNKIKHCQVELYRTSTDFKKVKGKTTEKEQDILYHIHASEDICLAPPKHIRN